MPTHARRLTLVSALAAASLVAGFVAAGARPAGSADWAMNATTIEACSCTMFCPCYFNTTPSGHHDHATGTTEHYCRANLAHRVNHGHFGDVDLAGVKFWEAADLGGDFTKGFDWMTLHFDPSVTPAQREAVLEIYNKFVKPLPYETFRVGEDATIEWNGGRDRAVARLDGGRLGEVVLNRNPGMTAASVVIQNLRYFGAARNDGFILMPNEIEAYRTGPNAFEYRGTNGFMITYELTSADVAAASAGK